MAVNAGQLFTQGTDGTLAIDTLLSQEANRIGPDIHKRTLHVSPWIDLIKQTAFPEGMGSTLGTLIYDRALPTTAANGSTLGVAWASIGGAVQDSAIVTASSLSQIIPGATDTNIGPQSGKSFIPFSRQFKQYSLKRAVVESPRINVEDLRFAAFRSEQLRAIMDAMTGSTRWTLEERYRDEYDRLCETVVVCKTGGLSSFIAKGTVAAPVQTFGAGGFFDVDLDTSPEDNTVDPAELKNPNGGISNKIMDSIYFRQVRGGAGSTAYGRENARPVFAAVMSSEASYALMTETGIRDDYRYNNSKVGDLIAPLGVERSHRGFYHLIDDMAPRFNFQGGAATGITAGMVGDCFGRVYPFTASSGIISNNAAYETATVELAYILHSEVMESQVPSSNVSGPGVSFNPVDYKGKYTWLNIQDEVINPDKTIGFFRGVIATASKPIKTEFGYVIAFLRNGTPAT